jgi:hypothetical protein
LSIDGTSLNSREIDRLFDYLDRQDLNDGALKISFAISFINRHSRQRLDDSPEKSDRRPEPGEFQEGDVAAIVFRKQPHVLEELSQMAVSLRKKGR